MLARRDDKYFVITKVHGISKGTVPGEYWGWDKNIGARIDAQPLMRDIAINPEQVDGLVVHNMIVKVIIQGEEHPIGVLDHKYRIICAGLLMKVKSYEITGYDAHKEKDYIKLGMNITFEINKTQADEWMTRNKKTWTASKESQNKNFSMYST